MIPKLKPGRKHDFSLSSTPLSEEVLKSMDLVMILTDHSDYDYQWIVENAQLVLDTRNATKDVTVGREKIVKA